MNEEQSHGDDESSVEGSTVKKVKGEKDERSLLAWTLIGLAPAFLHGLFLLQRSSNSDADLYVLFMPVFALPYLLVVALTSTRFRSAGFGWAPKLGFVFAFMILNVLLWFGGCALLMGPVSMN